MDLGRQRVEVSTLLRGHHGSMNSGWAETETATATPHEQMGRNGDNNDDG